MNRKRSIRALRLLALLLTAALVMTGCVGVFPPLPSLSGMITEPTASTPPPASVTPDQSSGETAEPSATDKPGPAETERPDLPDDEALIRWQNAGEKDYLPDEPVEMVPFSEMEYVRPDVEAIYADFDALTQRAAEGEAAETLLESYYELYTRYVSFYSMDSLAYIYYSQDTTESFYKDEYDFCENETPNLEEKLEALYKGFAAAPARNDLEEAYFGSGFFKQYDDYEVYTNPEYLRLSQEEAALLAEYRELTSEKLVTYHGITRSFDEWMNYVNSTEQLIGVYRAYYEQYNASVGEVYLKLIKVRQQLAAVLDYDSYAAYSYDMSYHRDYTPEDGAVFLNGIREHLVPVYEEAEESGAYSRVYTDRADEDAVMDMVRTAAENIGGAVWDAFRFMEAYELCDISQSPVKIESSFQTYLYDWEAPFVLVNAERSEDDYLTFSHEFGHFTDAFHNYSANEDLETAETFSQAMEFLAIKYTDTVSANARTRLIKYKLLDILSTFVSQGAYAEFESRVYALDPEELTVEKINDVFLDCLADYGLYTDDPTGAMAEFYRFYYARYWIDILHFFEVPNYIISYCVSAETALQVYELEAETEGEGVAAYFRLLDRDYSAGVQQVMEDAEMDNPFRDEVLRETADFFLEELGLD